MSNCYLLTASELSAMITAGYTLNSGPHVTLGDCQVACVGSGETHTTTCCPDNAIADSLTIEVSGCATGTGVLTYSGASDPGVLDIWYGVVVLDCITTEFILKCEGGSWLLLFGPEVICEGSSVIDTCDPFCLEFADISGNCLSVDCPACESPATLTVRIGCTYTPFTITYDADDTFTPDFTGNVQVEAWGAGGGGYGDVTKGGGGGGGAYAKLNSYAVTSGNNYTVNVGAAGGDDSFFVDSSTVMAKSAVDATTASGTAGGSAGSSVGDVKFSGGSGANASGADTGGGGGGSAGDAGNGGNASTITGGTAGTAGGGAGGNGGTGGSSGANGSVPGGGGGGNSLSSPPGNGGHGRVIITRIS